MKNLKFSLVLIFLLGCGAEPKQDCTANFRGQGLNLKIRQVSAQTYNFEMCGDPRSSYPAFTVYGAAIESDLTQPSILTRYRLSHVSAARSGDTFEVTFDSDLYFIIYADTKSGETFQYANSTELIRGALSQVVFSSTVE